jgi:hypothetical protein
MLDVHPATALRDKRTGNSSSTNHAGYVFNQRVFCMVNEEHENNFIFIANIWLSANAIYFENG